MKVALDRVMKTIAGVPVKDDSNPDKTLNLRAVAVNALLAPFPDEQSLSGEDKLKRYLLAQKVYASIYASMELHTELTVEEVALIKKLIGKMYTNLIAGQAWQMLEDEKAA